MFCVIITTVRPCSISRSASASLPIRRGSESRSWMSFSSASRAWFSGEVIVIMTNGRPFVLSPRVSIATLGLVTATRS